MLRTGQTTVALTIAVLICISASAQETRKTHNTLDLSQGTLALLQEEMRELAVASQALLISFVSGDWKSIQDVSEQIRASYVMEQSLTDAQKQELEEKLPERFKRLDMEFHARADKLESAAANENSELVAFHFYRLLESCAACHSEYAASRFPGFASGATDVHQH